MSEHDLIHIRDWPLFLNYVREDKRHAVSWRPSQVNLHRSLMLPLIRKLTSAQLGAFVRLVCEYADSPLCDPDGAETGPRRLTYEDSTESLRGKGGNATRLLDRLIQNGCVEVRPSSDRLEERRGEQKRSEETGAHVPNEVPQGGGRVEGQEAPPIGAGSYDEVEAFGLSLLNEGLTFEQIRERITERFPDYEIPDWFFPVENSTT